MSKVIEVPGMGNVEFPDDMSDDQISSAIQSQMAQASETPQAQTTAGGMDLADLAGTALGGAAAVGGAAYNDVLKPAANFAVQHPIMTGIGASYLPESVRKYVPLAETLKNLREGLVNKASAPTGPITAGPVTTTAPGVKIPINGGPLPSGTAVSTTPPVSMPTPATQPPSSSNFMSRVTQLADQYLPAARTAAKTAGTAAAGYELGKGLFYTSPEEIATMRAAEAQRRAQGWKPLNER